MKWLDEKIHYLLWIIPVFLPLIIHGYYLRLAIVTTYAITVAATLNILYGYTGLASLGHAAFYGIGAYTSAILVTEHGVPVMAAIVIAALVVGIISLFVGLPILRTRGLYFSIVTLAFNIVVFQVMNNWRTVTNGSIGYRDIPTFTGGDGMMFLMIYAFLLTVLAFKHELFASYVGKAFMAIREDEELAAEMGVNVYAYKTLSFVISSMLVGMTGAMFAHYNGFLAPSHFTMFESFNYFVIATVGGAGTMLGPVAGGVLLTLLPEALRVAPELRLVSYGFVLIFVIILMPNGIVGSIQDQWNSVKQTLPIATVSDEDSNVGRSEQP